MSPQQNLVLPLAQIENSIIESDWLLPHHPIPKATDLLIIKLPNASLHPVSKSHSTQKSMNKLTLNEPTILTYKFAVELLALSQKGKSVITGNMKFHTLNK